MAVIPTGIGATFISRAGSFCTYFYEAQWVGNEYNLTIFRRDFIVPGFGQPFWTQQTTAVSGYWSSTNGSGNLTNIPVDINMVWYPEMQIAGYAATYGTSSNTVDGAVVTTKTVSIPGTASAPSAGSITASGADVSCDYVPNVTISTTSAQLQYKRTVDTEWIDFGSPKTDGTGYGTVTVGPISLTGLLPATSYQVRVVVTRTTINDTVVTGSATSFVTLPGEPEIVTDAASSVAHNTATLNATVTINSGTGVTVFWKYGTDNPPTQNTTSSNPVSADGSYGIDISGLVSSTVYFVQAFVAFATPSGSPNNGLVVSFTTASDPGAEAPEEEHMHIYDYDGKYGVAKTVYFTLQDNAADSSDRLVTTAPGALFVAGDIKVSKDGGAFANVANAVTQIAALNPLYSLQLSATEMQAEDVIVQIVDQDGPAFRDALLHARTKLMLGQVDVDASQLTNATAMKLTGQGSGHGLEAIGGATGLDIKGFMENHFLRVSDCQANVDGTVVKLDASASATDDFYNGSIVGIVGGTGIGQGRVITDYNGTTKEATVDTAWVTIPTAGSTAIITGGPRVWEMPAPELVDIPEPDDPYGVKLQMLFQRFAFKIKQTAGLQTWYDSGATVALATRVVDDNGAEQTLFPLINA